MHELGGLICKTGNLWINGKIPGAEEKTHAGRILEQEHALGAAHPWALDRGFDHIFSLILFLGQVKVLAFCRSVRLPNHYFVLPSSITPWYLEDINPLHFSSYEFLMK